MNTPISQSELMAHPLMAKVTADIAETRAKQKAEQVMADLEAQRLRHDQGLYLKSQFDKAIADYERLRVEAHAAVGTLWAAQQAYSRLTGVSPGTFMEGRFNEINLPSMIPDTRAWAMSSIFTTTQAAVAGWFASQGKQWL